MELFRYTTSKKFMYFGKRKCMVESCVPSCKRQLFNMDEESIFDDVTSQYQESMAPSHNKDWVTCLKSNLHIDSTSSMNKFQLYLEVLNVSIEEFDSDEESIETSDSDNESSYTSDSDVESIDELESESIDTSDSDAESISTFESDYDNISILKNVYQLNNSNNSTVFSECDNLESNINTGHSETSENILYDSGFYSDSSVNIGTDLLSFYSCFNRDYSETDKLIQNGDVIEGQCHNDVMFCQDENVIMASDMQWATSSERQTTKMIFCDEEKIECSSICDDYGLTSDFCPSSAPSELFPLDFMAMQ